MEIEWKYQNTEHIELLLQNTELHMIAILIVRTYIRFVTLPYTSVVLNSSLTRLNFTMNQCRVSFTNDNKSHTELMERSFTQYHINCSLSNSMIEVVPSTKRSIA